MLLILGIVLVGVILFLNTLKENNNTSQNFLDRIFPGSKVKIQKNPYHYKIDLKDYFIKKISIGTQDFLIIFGNETSYSSIYSIYTNSGNPVKLVQIESIPASSAKEALEDNFFEKDITGDGVEELFLKIFTTGKGQNAYNILRLVNNKLETMTTKEWSTENKTDIILFDAIEYRNGSVVIIEHDLDVRSMLRYEVDGNLLVPSSSITFKLTDLIKGDKYEVIKTTKDQGRQVIDQKIGNIWTDSFTPYE